MQESGDMMPGCCEFAYIICNWQSHSFVARDKITFALHTTLLGNVKKVSGLRFMCKKKESVSNHMPDFPTF